MDTNQKLGERKRAAGDLNTTIVNATSPLDGFGMLFLTDQHDRVTIGVHSLATTSPSNDSHDSQDVSAYQTLAPAADPAGRSNKRKLIPPLIPYSTYATVGRPPPPIILPLSADHRLITLIQYNAIRALLFNMAILSILDYLPSECSVSFGVTSLSVTSVETIPPDLQSTPLQQSTPHPYWIDIIPFPAMRDNLILLAGEYDSYDLRCDLGECLYAGFDDAERRGFLVWQDPWRIDGWEISEGFVRKWGYLLKGCTDVIESTNRWREMRGEDRLIVEDMTELRTPSRVCQSYLE